MRLYSWDTCTISVSCVFFKSRKHGNCHFPADLLDIPPAANNGTAGSLDNLLKPAAL